MIKYAENLNNFVDINELKEDPLNAKIHTEKQISQLAKIIKKYGFSDPIVITKDMEILAGHGRCQALKLLGETKVPVVIADLKSEAEKRAFALSHNAVNIETGFNKEMVQKNFEIISIEPVVLEELRTVDLSVLEPAKIDAVNLAIDNPEAFYERINQQPEIQNIEANEKDDKVPEPREEYKFVKRGDIWLLGNHRIGCLDSCNVDDISKLMNGKLADMVFTDPPYCVNYTKKTKEVFKTKEYTEIKNDNKTKDDMKDFFREVFSTIFLFLKEDTAYYICSPQGGDSEMMMMMMMRECGIKCRHQLIWIKDTPVFSMGRLDYDYQHEPILYGWTKKHNFYGNGNKKKSIWEFKRTENKLHPTMKPVELICNAILNSSIENNIIVDFFLGSGSTLIACEKSNRICYGSEIDPHYCGVIINRYINFKQNNGEDVFLLQDDQKIPYKKIINNLS